MSRILFTDGTGAVVLHNGKIGPGSRFANWTPQPKIIGDAANRDSDGALYVFKRRTDYGATFDLPMIPTAAAPVNTLGEIGDIEGSIGAAPSGFGTASPNIVRVVLHPTLAGAPTRGIGKNSLFAECVRDNGTGNSAVAATFPALVNTRNYFASAWVFIPPASGLADVWLSFDLNMSAATQGHADMSRLGTWQLLTCTGTCNLDGGSQLAVHLTGSTNAYCWADDFAINDLTAGTTERQVDNADRLVEWLLSGGTCQVDTGDYDGNSYATCSLMPGMSPSLVLTDKKLLEYTLSLPLINLAGARMRCHYAA